MTRGVSRGLSRLRPQRGAVSVEFVLILPILLLLLFGIIQFAYYFFQVQQGAFAAREAARQLAVGQLSCAELQTFVKDRVGVPTSINLQVDAPSTPAVGDNIRVLVEFQAADFGFPFIPFPNNAAVSEDAETRVENVTANSNGYSACDVVIP